MARPDTPEILIPAIAANAATIARLDAAKKKRPLTPKQEASRASAVAKLNDYVRRYTALTPAAQPAAADPFPGLSMAARSLAWDHEAADAEINRKLTDLGLDGPDDIPAQITALGPVLGAKAIALGRAGAPGTYGTDAVDYDAALPYGGYWNVSSGRDAGGDDWQGPGGGSDWGTAWNASKAVRTYRNRGADPVLNNLEIARANGIDIASPNRPATDYKGEFTAPIDF